MRLLFPVAIAAASLASSAATSSPSNLGKMTGPVAGSECPDADRYMARRGGKWQDKPVRPQKLNQLPPADAFASVLRTDERGCMVLVKYRDVRR